MSRRCRLCDRTVNNGNNSAEFVRKCRVCGDYCCDECAKKIYQATDEVLRNKDLTNDDALAEPYRCDDCHIWTKDQSSEPPMLLSADLRKRLQPEEKQCWWNAIRAGIIIEGQGNPRTVVLYQEGFALMPDFGISFEHGWITVNGRIVEPTLKKVCTGYFPAGTYSIKEARALCRKQKSRGMPLTGWPGNRDLPAWREANIQSLAAAFKRPAADIRKFFEGHMPLPVKTT